MNPHRPYEGFSSDELSEEMAHQQVRLAQLSASTADEPETRGRLWWRRATAEAYTILNGVVAEIAHRATVEQVEG